MDSIKANFSNNTIDISNLPDFEQVALNPVNKKLLTKHLLQLGVWFIIFITISDFLYYLDQIFLSALVGVFLALISSCLLFICIKEQSIYGYAIRERDLIYQRGYLITKTTIISFNRIQHVSINRSLLDKWLGLSSLKVFTAGGNGSDISIAGLEPQLAEKLKQALAGNIAEEHE
ncbi:PH domain-containing protein [Zunongwangia sp.]|uniref:PH domain-containing protein n=1 Tax=Zunongwangia sp. TaxID=1965325 RepID=UPI003AA9D5F3